MKRLIITLEYPPHIGGIATYVYNFLRHVPPQDYVLYAPIREGDKKFDENNRWKTYRKQPYWFFWPHWLRMYFQVRKIVKDEKIEEIYIHHSLPVGYVGFLLKKLKGIPYVLFLHGTDVAMGTRSAWKERLFGMVLREAKKIVVNSHFLEHKVKNKIDALGDVQILYPCPNEKFLKPVSEEEIAALKSRLALNGKKVIVTVSRMADGKGYPHIIRLLTAMSQEIPNLVWLFIGDGPKKQTIVDLVQKNYLQNVVRFLGAVPNEALPPYYQVADLFVLLGHQDEEAEEGWGIVFLEAAASGLPVVAGRVGGVEEAVENLRTGIIVDVYQGKMVVKTIVDLLRNRNFALEMGRNGRQRVEREFLWDKQISKL